MMRYSIHLTRDWSYEKMAPYHDAITKAMEKLAARFPDDVELDVLAKQIIHGEVQFWLILDQARHFVAFVTSRIEQTASGKRRLLLLELAGRGGIDLVAMLQPIEQWAQAEGVDEICPIGRTGWRRALAAQGYKPFITRYRKELK